MPARASVTSGVARSVFMRRSFWGSRRSQVRIDQHLRGASNVPRRAAHPQRLGSDLGAFHQEKQLVGEEPRLPGSHLGANLGKPGAQFRLVYLDHLPSGVILLGEFHRGIRHGAASRLGIGNVLRQQSEGGLDLSAWVIGMPARHRVPGLPEVGVVLAQPFGHQLVLGGEVPVQAHLGRIGFRCNRFHPDRTDSLEVEKLRCRFEDALPRARAVRVPLPEGRLSVDLGASGHVQSVIDRRVTGQYHTTCFWKQPVGISPLVSRRFCWQSDGWRQQGGPIARFSLRDTMTNSFTRKEIAFAVILAFAAGLLITTLGCSPAPSAVAAVIKDKVYTVNPNSVKVTAGIVTGELTEMQVTERIEEGSGRVTNPAKLTGKLALKNISADQTVRLVGGKILYIDVQGRPIKLEANRTEPTIKGASTYGSSERLDPGQDATQTVDVEFPVEALKAKKLKEIRLELSYIPSPFKEQKLNFTVSIGGQ